MHFLERSDLNSRSARTKTPCTVHDHAVPRPTVKVHTAAQTHFDSFLPDLSLSVVRHWNARCLWGDFNDTLLVLRSQFEPFDIASTADWWILRHIILLGHDHAEASADVQSVMASRSAHHCSVSAVWWCACVGDVQRFRNCAESRVKCNKFCNFLVSLQPDCSTVVLGIARCSDVSAILLLRCGGTSALIVCCMLHALSRLFFQMLRNMLSGFSFLRVHICACCVCAYFLFFTLFIMFSLHAFNFSCSNVVHNVVIRFVFFLLMFAIVLYVLSFVIFQCCSDRLLKKKKQIMLNFVFMLVFEKTCC